MVSTTPKFRIIEKAVTNVKEGDVILYTEDHPCLWTITETSMRRDEHGMVYQFRFSGDDNPPPMAFRKDYKFLVAIPMPKDGDPASMRVGSDVYPFEVVRVSKSGAKIWLRRMDYRITSGSFQTGDAVIEYTSNEDNPSRPAYWSATRNRYMMSGSPVAIGHARYYQDPSY